MVSKQIETDLVFKKIQYHLVFFFTAGVGLGQLFYLGYSGIDKTLESLLTSAVGGFKAGHTLVTTGPVTGKSLRLVPEFLTWLKVDYEL